MDRKTKQAIDKAYRIASRIGNAIKPKRDVLRRCRFRPYRIGMGPTFSLLMWDTGRRNDQYGERFSKPILGYQLNLHPVPGTGPCVCLFEGEDYGCSSRHAIDSNESVEALMGFLTLRPGDTDSEYFDRYTAEQFAYCAQHAEALSGEVSARFCDENGNVRKRGGR